MQELTLGITVVLITVLAAVFALVLTHAKDRSELEEIAPKGYIIRNRLFKTLIIGGLVVAALSLPRSFFAINAMSGDTQVINAVGYQWYWDIDQDEAIAGKPVEFLVKSADVTHGFGIYDKDMRLLAQTQAMPGYTNRLNFTFEEPGVYQLLCLEFCGVAHHDMVAEINVLPAPATK